MTTPTPPPDPTWAASAWDWIGVCRRARMHHTTLAVALVMASYADPDGSNVRPGLALVSYDAKVSYNTAQKHVAKLRAYGLIELVRKGSGRRGGNRAAADVYRLIFHPELLDRLDIPNPAQAALAVERIRRAHEGDPGPVSASDVVLPDPAEAVETRELHPISRGAKEPMACGKLVDNMPVAVDADVDNSELHPISWGALRGTSELNAPHLTTPETGNAPHLSQLMHPTNWGATYQGPTTNYDLPTVEQVSTDLTVPRTRPTIQDRIFDDEINTRTAGPPLAKILEFRRPERRRTTTAEATP